MKAIKIDIKKELIELNKPYYDELALKDIDIQTLKDGEVPVFSESIADKIRYEVKKVSNNGEIKNYLVKLNDREIFNELLEISNSSLKRNEERFYKKGEIYWIRLWLGWLKSNRFRRFIFKKQIISIQKSLNDRY